MSMDLSQFHQVFFEESQEHLDTLEHGLMHLNIEAPDRELLNSIFRAAHSMKGSGGVFGFVALSDITHALENQLDRWRKHLDRPQRDQVDHMLTVIDVLRSLLGIYQAGEPVDQTWVDQVIADMGAVFETGHAEVGVSDDTPVSPPDTESDNEAFGFFDDEPNEPDDSGFGFFSDDPEPEPAEPETDGYGFFSEPDAAVSPSGDSEPYGFFEPADASVEADAGAETDEPMSAGPSRPADATGPGRRDASVSATQSDPPPASSGKPADAVASQSIRVNVDKVDNLINLVGELVITQSMLAMMEQDIATVPPEKFASVVEELQRNTREIQESVMSIRMLPVSFIFNRFPRVVRDTANKLGKQVELVIEGGETEIDKGLVEKLSDPLTHLVRNSIDHGIERPEARRALGKPETGVVRLKAHQQGGNIILTIMDDGAGLNRNKILEKARERGLPADDTLPDAAVWPLIFEPGFSTADAVTDVSGRGVGMDVVKRNLAALGGRIDIESVEGYGTTLTLLLPLTLAIVDGMAVSVGQETYIVPLANIVESIQPDPALIKTVNGDELLNVRGHYWPIIRLYQAMETEPNHPRLDAGIVILVESGNQRFGLLADELIGQQQVVIKSLEQHYKRIVGVAGATIMGDGTVALILDLSSLGKQVSTTDALEKVS